MGLFCSQEESERVPVAAAWPDGTDPHAFPHKGVVTGSSGTRWHQFPALSLPPGRPVALVLAIGSEVQLSRTRQGGTEVRCMLSTVSPLLGRRGPGGDGEQDRRSRRLQSSSPGLRPGLSRGEQQTPTPSPWGPAAVTALTPECMFSGSFLFTAHSSVKVSHLPQRCRGETDEQPPVPALRPHSPGEDPRVRVRNTALLPGDCSLTAVSRAAFFDY